MSAYERQILNTERFYDRQIRAIEESGAEIFSSVVPGSRLHEKIHNPITEGIDEGWINMDSLLLEAGYPDSK